MNTLPTDEVAQLCWDHYYRTEFGSPNSIQEYLTGAGADYSEHDTDLENLVEALYDDIRDLLHNGNQEDLFGPTLNGEQADRLAEELHDGWREDPDPLETLCRSLANLILTKHKEMNS